MGRPEDLAGMAVFLASDASDYVVAQTYNVMAAMDELMEPAGKDIRATALCNASLADLADRVAVPSYDRPA